MIIGSSICKRAMNAIAVVTVVLAAGASLATAQTKQPNIIIIWGDDIGITDVSAYSMGLMGFHTP